MKSRRIHRLIDGSGVIIRNFHGRDQLHVGNPLIDNSVREFPQINNTAFNLDVLGMAPDTKTSTELAECETLCPK